MDIDEEFDDDLSDDAVPDEAFYYTEVEAEIETDEPNIKSPNPPSPPTLSHRYVTISIKSLLLPTCKYTFFVRH